MLLTRRLDRLIWAQIDGDITPKDHSRLETRLHRSERVRRCYVDACLLHEALTTHYQGDRHTGLGVRVHDDRLTRELSEARDDAVHEPSPADRPTGHPG